MSIAKMLIRSRMLAAAASASKGEKISKGEALVRGKLEEVKHLVGLLENVQKENKLANNPQVFNVERIMENVKEIVKDIPGVKFGEV